MSNTVTLGELFAKAQDFLTPSFDSVHFEADVDNLSKAETENLLGQIQAEILKGGDYDMLTEMRSIALDHLDDIEKARHGIYADTAENRKLGRVGQEYGGVGSRDGNGKTPQERQTAKSKNGSKNTKEVYDEDFNDDLKYFLDNFGPFGAPKEADGVKVGSVNDKGEIWVPNHNKTKDGGYEGQWMSKKEIEDRANRHRIYNNDSKLTSEQKKAWPIGTKYTDKKGREFTIVKHDSNRGRIKLLHKTDDGKKKVAFLSGYNLKTGLHPNFTTGFPEIDEKLREVYDKAHGKMV